MSSAASYPSITPWGAFRLPLRAWQREALDAYARASQAGARDFLAVATPGAGKTAFALQVASELLGRGAVQALTVVTPTEHLKRQWADAAARAGIAIDPDFRNGAGATARDFTGIALTYAAVAAHPLLHRRRTEARRTLVVLDELHHGGDALAWGDAVREAFEPATRRLALTGTPFRSDVSPIPFVTYAPGPDGVRRSVADYSYGYGRALRDGVVRPVIFLAYAGQTRWRTSAGDEVSAGLGEPLTRDLVQQAWRTALDPHGNWIPSVLAAADRRLTEVRRHVPDAGGLVIASDHASARAYAARLRALTGEAPAVVLSDDAGASDRIEAFAASDARWMVAVRMVSEGVDVPRLAVGVYATSVATPLFFAQAVGRFVRARRRGETASVFLPSVPALMGFAAELELERDHALDQPLREGTFAPEEDLLAAAQQRRDTPGEQEPLAFQALAAEASFDRALFDGGEFGTAEEEADYLGLPGLLEPDQVASLLRRRPAPRQQPEPAPAPAPAPAPSTHRERAALRKELHGLVGAWHRRTNQPHASIHAELRRACGGPATAQAGVEELRRRVDTLRRWAVGRS